MQLQKIINPYKLPHKLQKKVQIEYKTLNELLNHLDIDGKKIDILMLQGYTLDEAIMKLVEEIDEHNNK